MAAALDARKRVPLAPIEQARPQVYRDPSTSLVTASTSAVSSQQPRLRRLAAASALTSLASKSTSRPTKAVRSSSASSDAQLKHAYTSASDTERPAPLATRKRRANSVDTTAQQGRNVRARVESHERVVDQPTRYRTRLVAERQYEYFEPAADQEVKSYRRALGQKYEYRETVTDRDVDHHRRVASQKSELDAYSTTSVESRDSQTTVVDDALHGRRVARPSRAFASLHAARALSPFEDAPQAEEDATRAEDAAKSKENRDWDDLDADDEDDPMMVAEYIEDIIEYLREVEPRSMPDTAYMGKQMDLTWDMRRVLVNWIIQIHYQFRMLPETLFLAVNLIDRFLSKRHVSVAKLQLVGLTGLLIASKYEETTTPHIKDFRYLAGNCYTIEEILNAEFFMLCVLEFDMSYPNPMTFLRRVSKAEQYNIQSRTVAKYLMEVCLVDHRLMAFPPSHIAAAGICLARRMLHSGEWDANLRHFSGFEEAELQP
ncbi:G2/mitotic-specific cyclin, partial [Linderina macrospora]